MSDTEPLIEIEDAVFAELASLTSSTLQFIRATVAQRDRLAAALAKAKASECDWVNSYSDKVSELLASQEKLAACKARLAEAVKLFGNSLRKTDRYSDHNHKRKCDCTTCALERAQEAWIAWEAQQ